jgi:hypothetical protein
MEPIASSTDMNEERRTAVYASVGKALKQAQHYEQALKFFIRTVDRIKPGGDDPQRVEALVRSPEKQTLGLLLGRFKRRVKISDPGVPTLLQEAVDKRKFLAHHFFLERENLIADEEGRISMIKQMEDIEELLRKAGTLMRAMGTVLQETIDGIRKETCESPLFSMEIDEV